jgi:hypothetical protein
MNYFRKSIPWLDGLAFASLALGILGVMFVWLPAAGVCLAAAGLLFGFFGLLTALQNHDGSAFYLMIGTVISAGALLLNLGLVTNFLTRLF